MQSKEIPRIVEYRDFKHFNRTNIFLALESLSNLNLDSIWNTTSHGKSRRMHFLILKTCTPKNVTPGIFACDNASSPFIMTCGILQKFFA